jgi:hypothetical protein
LALLIHLPHDSFAIDPVPIAKTTNKPILDGNLNDSIWQEATCFENFKTIEPDYGLPPVELAKIFANCTNENFA